MKKTALLTLTLAVAAVNHGDYNRLPIPNYREKPKPYTQWPRGRKKGK